MNKGKSVKTASTTSLGLLILLVLSCLIGRSLKLFFMRAKVPVEFHKLVEDARFLVKQMARRNFGTLLAVWRTFGARLPKQQAR
jgi:hypothetical protein